MSLLAHSRFQISASADGGAVGQLFMVHHMYMKWVSLLTPINYRLSVNTDLIIDGPRIQIEAMANECQVLLPVG